jgi:hypothetical protein
LVGTLVNGDTDAGLLVDGIMGEIVGFTEEEINGTNGKTTGL